MSYFQAIVIALVQGVTELFPVSSLGHSVLVPAWFGGSWQALVTQSSTASSETSFYLAYIVALHCATALALLWFFWTDWVRIVRGFFRTLGGVVRTRSLPADDADARLAWLIVIATIPVGITGLALEHTFRTIFAKPLGASIFLVLNALILFAGERYRRRASIDADAAEARALAEAQVQAQAIGGRSEPEIALAAASDARLAHVSVADSVRIGLLQVAALLPGISRSGITMVGGLWRGLSHEDAARFAFLLATPVILAAGVLKLPSLAGHAGDHIHGQVAVGFVICGITAYLSVRFLVRWFETKTLTPFAIYSLIFGVVSVINFA